MGGTLGLFDDPACTPPHKVTAPAAFLLATPQQVDGKTIFRRQFWLRLPGGALAGDRLALAAGSAIGMRFAPATVTVPRGDTNWLASVVTEEPHVKVTLAYPAPVIRIDSAVDRQVELHRFDGAAVSDKATVTGITNTFLADPFVGPNLALKFGREVQRLDKLRESAKEVRVGRAAASAQGHSAAVGETEAKSAVRAEAALTGPFAGLRLDGRPTSPRLRLVLPAQNDWPEEVLWQVLEAGEHAAQVLLPGTVPPLSAAWQGALERLQGLVAGGDPPPSLLLRLDAESDAPCRVELIQASLAAETQVDLLNQAQTLRFDGTTPATRQVQLAVPPDGQPIRIDVEIQTAGATMPAAPSEALPAAGRAGCLLDAEQRVTLALSLPAPGYLCGIALPWHPLSEKLTGTLRLKADGGTTPAAQPLLEAAFDLATATPAWLALRWSALPLQAGRYWLELALKEGSGLWLAETGGAVSDGWTEQSKAPAEPRRPLGVGLALQPLYSDPVGSAAPAFTVALNGMALSLAEDNGVQVATLELENAAPPALPWTLAVTSGSPLSLALKAARLACRV